MKKFVLVLGMLLGIGAPAATIAATHSPEMVMVAAEAPASETNPVQESISAWDKFVKEWITPDKVAMYMSWLAYIGTIIGLVANIKRLKKANNLTLKDVSDDVKKTLEETVGKEVAAQTEKFLPDIIAIQTKTNDILKIFSKILALSQENTPESRVAILQLVEELGSVGKEITENAKQAIQDEVTAIQEHKDQVDEKLDKIISEYNGTSI